MKAQQEFMDMSLNSAFSDFYSGFLTPDEMHKVINGKDMWLTPEEVRARWKLRKRSLEA